MKIAASFKTNEVRIKRMNCRNECLKQLRAETLARLIEDMNNDADLYRATVKNLILQGMIKLLEDEVELLCRKGETDLIEGLVQECEEEFSAHMLEQTGREYSTKLTVITNSFLSLEEGSECGGVILIAHERRIVVPNTLLDRLNLVFEAELPRIRHMLFPRQ